MRKLFKIGSACFAFVLAGGIALGQPLARLTLTAPAGSTAFPVTADVKTISTINPADLQLVEIIRGSRNVVPFQKHRKQPSVITWIVRANKIKQDQERVYELRRSKAVDQHSQRMEMVNDEGSVVLKHLGRNLVQFNHKTMYPPAGVDSSYKRSGFIHPIWSAAGHVLTRVQPPDHYHHYGLWNPWAKVMVDDSIVDFWNLNKKQGTVRFANYTDTFHGAVSSGFKAILEHVVLDHDIEITAITEELDVEAYSLDKNRWLMDYTSSLTAAPGKKVTLKMYTYGGLGFRATEVWTNKNSTVTTSEGRNRKDADSTRARWSIVEGDFDGKRSGILFMSHPANFNSPEPIRVWPQDIYNRGDVFFSFSPTKTSDWNLNANKKNTLRYQMLIFDGNLETSEAEQIWQRFAKEIKVDVTLM